MVLNTYKKSTFLHRKDKDKIQQNVKKRIIISETCNYRSL